MKKRVLVVDNDISIRVLCAEALSMAGYMVDRASNGSEALRNLDWMQYDLVISDVEMPVLDGLGLYHNVLKDHSYLKDRFIFITGSVGDDKITTIEFLKQRYLVKPFKVSHLLNTVSEVLSDPPGPDLP